MDFVIFKVLGLDGCKYLANFIDFLGDLLSVQLPLDSPCWPLSSAGAWLHTAPVLYSRSQTSFTMPSSLCFPGASHGLPPISHIFAPFLASHGPCLSSLLEEQPLPSHSKDSLFCFNALPSRFQNLLMKILKVYSRSREPLHSKINKFTNNWQNKM